MGLSVHGPHAHRMIVSARAIGNLGERAIEPALAALAPRAADPSGLAPDTATARACDEARAVPFAAGAGRLG